MIQAKELPMNKTEVKFHPVDVGLIAGSHFVHDLFTAFVSPLLPEIIRQLGISLTQAGTLSAVMQVPSVLNPYIGFIDDRRNLKILLILAPGLTATFLSMMGLASNYLSLLLLLFITGISIAAFHAIAPARLARLAGRNTGLGMSLFMSGGEFGRTVGPLVAVWAVSIWTIRGIFPLAVFGWLASLALGIRLNSNFHTQNQRPPVNQPIPAGMLRFFIPVTVFIFMRGLMISGLGLYLPTLITSQGYTLWKAGGMLAVYQLAGSLGALTGGTLSDWVGRRRVLALTVVGSSLFLWLHLTADSILSVAFLLIVGFLNLMTQPIMLAFVQDHFPENRSLANGAYMGLTFIALSIATVVVGVMGDWMGLKSAFLEIALLSLTALPALLFFKKASLTSELSP